MFMEGIQAGLCKERILCLVFRDQKGSRQREEGNKNTATVIYLQDSCQLQDIMLPVLFKGVDARKSAKQRKGEIWGMWPI